MIKKILILCCVLLLCINGVSADAKLTPSDATSHVPQRSSAENTLYLEKMNSFLNILDDEKKRDECVRDITQNFKANVFNFTQMKNFVFYILKLCILLLLYIGLKHFGLKMLAYQMDLLRKGHAQRMENADVGVESLSKIETFTTLFTSIFTWVLRILFILMFMTALGINVNPLIYGVSFLGIGMSFASQSVIKDFINGILNVMDGSIAVGEMIQTGKHKGIVEHITLRSLSLRCSSGELVVVPFSNISDIINYSRTFSKVKVELIIAANQKMEDVRTALSSAFDEFKKIYGSTILEDTLYSGVNRITENGSHVYAVFKAKPDPTGRMKSFFYTCIHEQMIKFGINRIDGSNEYLVFQKEAK